jgi:hypothetical protein
MMCHPPSLFTLTVASRSERPESTLHPKDVAVFPWLSAASLPVTRGPSWRTWIKLMGQRRLARSTWNLQMRDGWVDKRDRGKVIEKARVA